MADENIKYEWDKFTVLVIEDDDINFLFIEEALEDTGINVIHAKTGEEGLRLFQDKEGVDIVLMDIRLPGMSGYETTKDIRSINPSIPIIAQTAYALQKDKDQALEAGCDDYIAKPIHFETLISTMSKYLNQ